MTLPAPYSNFSFSKIVSKPEEEQKLIDANKKLIAIFEQKIKEKITEVWGDEQVAEFSEPGISHIELEKKKKWQKQQRKS